MKKNEKKYRKNDVDLQNGQSNCIFVVQFGGETSESIEKRRGLYEADTKGSRRIAEEFYTYIVPWREGHNVKIWKMYFA